jgi:hypothetical protein
MLVWGRAEKNGTLRAFDDCAAYIIRRSQQGDGYDVSYLPAPGPEVDWAHGLTSLDEAKDAAEACVRHVGKLRAESDERDRLRREASRTSRAIFAVVVVIAIVALAMFFL